jgi:hypothetical protein
MIRGPLAHALADRGIKCGTGWESRLLSGGEIEYHDLSSSTFHRMPALAWTPPASR